MITPTETILLDPLPFQIDFPRLLSSLHMEESTRHAAEIRQLAVEAAAIARPKGLFRLCFIGEKGTDTVSVEGITFTSRVLRVNLGELQRVFAFVCTSGHELDAWAHAPLDTLSRFYADAVNEAVLHAAIASLWQYITDRFAVAQLSAMNPGSLVDWPLREQRPLFGLLGDVKDAIGVALTDSLLMVPTKSVSGFLFPGEETFASCQLCPRAGCPNRRAPYDADLFQRKYSQGSPA